MDIEIKKEARKQFFHYFRIWFVAIGILAVAFIAAQMYRSRSISRANNMAPVERVFDFADVLTEDEEQKLEDYIAEQESRNHFDIVLVTMNQEIESQGYYDDVMFGYADDFYDKNNFGFNAVHGDGVLLLDNWYEDEKGSQKGSCLSTCGRVYDAFGNDEINRVLDAVYDRVDKSPYEAYRQYVKLTCELMERNQVKLRIPVLLMVIMPILTAAVYAFYHLKQSPAKDTTAANAYVAGGRPVMRVSSDDFIRKSVVTRRINTNSGGGRSSGGGRGGSHRSSSGVHHGGGVRRR